jgi:hypothetical protein
MLSENGNINKGFTIIGMNGKETPDERIKGGSGQCPGENEKTPEKRRIICLQIGGWPGG